MILRNRKINKIPEMEEIINEAEVCTVAMVNEDSPYILPFNFAYKEQTLATCDTVRK